MGHGLVLVDVFGIHMVFSVYIIQVTKDFREQYIFHPVAQYLWKCLFLASSVSWFDQTFFMCFMLFQVDWRTLKRIYNQRKFNGGVFEAVEVVLHKICENIDDLKPCRQGRVIF